MPKNRGTLRESPYNGTKGDATDDDSFMNRSIEAGDSIHARLTRLAMFYDELQTPKSGLAANPDFSQDDFDMSNAGESLRAQPIEQEMGTKSNRRKDKVAGLAVFALCATSIWQSSAHSSVNAPQDAYRVLTFLLLMASPDRVDDSLLRGWMFGLIACIIPLFAADWSQIRLYYLVISSYYLSSSGPERALLATDALPPYLSDALTIDWLPIRLLAILLHEVVTLITKYVSQNYLESRRWQAFSLALLSFCELALLSRALDFLPSKWYSTRVNRYRKALTRSPSVETTHQQSGKRPLSIATPLPERPKHDAKSGRYVVEKATQFWFRSREYLSRWSDETLPLIMQKSAWFALLFICVAAIAQQLYGFNMLVFCLSRKLREFVILGPNTNLVTVLAILIIAGPQALAFSVVFLYYTMLFHKTRSDRTAVKPVIAQQNKAPSSHDIRNSVEQPFKSRDTAQMQQTGGTGRQSDPARTADTSTGGTNSSIPIESEDVLRIPLTAENKIAITKCMDNMPHLRRCMLFDRLYAAGRLKDICEMLSSVLQDSEIAITSLHTRVVSLLDLYHRDLASAAASLIEIAAADLLRRQSCREAVAAKLVERIAAPWTAGSSPANQFYGTAISAEIHELRLFIESELSAHVFIQYPMSELLPQGQLTELMEKFLFEGGEFDRFMHGMCLLAGDGFRDTTLCSIVMSLYKFEVTFTDALTTGWLDRCLTYIEQRSVCRWNWWPLPLPSCALFPTLVRVKWKCPCRRNHHRDVTKAIACTLERVNESRTFPLLRVYSCMGFDLHRYKGSVKRLPVFIKESEFNDPDLPQPFVMRSKPSQRMPDNTTKDNVSSFTPAANIGANATSPSSKPGFQIHTDSQDHILDDTKLLSGLDHTLDERTGLTSILRLIFGTEGRKKVSLSMDQLKMHHHMKDSDAISSMLMAYQRLRGFYKYWFSVFKLESFDFMKFVKHDRQKVYRQRDNLLIPESDPDYEYTEGSIHPPCLERPPVDPSEFSCLINACSKNCIPGRLQWHECNKPSDSSSIVSRLPKKKTPWELDNHGRSVAWGLDCTFEISAMRVLAWHVAIVVLCFGLGGHLSLLLPEPISHSATVPLTLTIVAVSAFWASAGILKPYDERLKEYTRAYGPVQAHGSYIHQGDIFNTTTLTSASQFLDASLQPTQSSSILPPQHEMQLPILR